MNSFDSMTGAFDTFNLIFIIMLVLFVFIFAFAIINIFSPKLRAKFMKKQIQATKYMVEESQDDLEDLATVSSNISIRSRKRVMDSNEDLLKDMSTRNATINKKSMEITAEAIKKGLSKNNRIYCKYCGEIIDDDSLFCKYCGKKQNK